MLRRMEYYTSLPHGIFLVTGPTGSGKSTTLYSALKRINQTDKKIITIEDPVEYQMDGINQIHVNPQIGLTFAAGLRHIVRQDPGRHHGGRNSRPGDWPISPSARRSPATSCIRTLHTNDAPSAITRLTDMGVENYLLTSSLVAVLAQRLVPRDLRAMPPARGRSDGSQRRPPAVLPRRGMRALLRTGYRGRVGYFVLMELNEELRANHHAERGRQHPDRGSAAERHAQSARRRLGKVARGADYTG
jgi:type II secretory ATPase GspE/PulE/Tfp pilus assembly ATPase PilB-like protein